MLYFIFVILCYFFSFVSIRMKNNYESAISLLLVSLYIDWNFISYTFTFSFSLLSSINLVPSSERYKLQNRFRGFFCCFVLFVWFFWVFFLVIIR